MSSTQSDDVYSAPNPEYRYAGFDIAKKQDYAAIVIIKIVEDTAYLLGLKQYPRGLHYDRLWDDVLRLYMTKRLRWRVMAVDQGNVGEVAVEELPKRHIPYEGVQFSAPRKHAMVQGLNNLYQQKRLILPQNPRVSAMEIQELKSQLAEQERKVSAAGTPLYQHPENRHDDLFWALCLAIYAARRRLFHAEGRILNYEKQASPSQIDWKGGYSLATMEWANHQKWLAARKV